ncbi:alanine racemase [Candidatus Bipolaricaulota bacterium]|nr:alanine racemase [Candidatus Bipolaricaulota bacterium]
MRWRTAGNGKTMVRAEIDLWALRANLVAVRERLPRGCSLMFVVKEDAYGHGLLRVAEASQDLVDWYGVASLAEARALRRLGLSHPIFIMLPPLGKALLQAIREGYHLPIGDEGMVAEVPRAARRAGRPALVHLAVDTGMGRFGLLPEEAEEAVQQLLRSPHVRLVGVYSHLSSAHAPSQDDIAFTRAQVWKFRKCLEDWLCRGIEIPWRHLANSAAALAFPEGTAPPFNMVRVGTVIYGYPEGPLPSPLSLRPVARVWTEVTAVRRLPPGWPVGYERLYVTPGPRQVAVLGAGYGDGLRPELGRVTIRDRTVPLLGKIGMDTAMADVTGVPNVRRGDRALLFGPEVERPDGWACPVLVPVLLSARRRWIKGPIVVEERCSA